VAVNDPTPPVRGLPPPDRLLEEASPRIALVLRVGLTASMLVFLGTIATYLALHPNALREASPTSETIHFLTLGGLGHGLATGAPIAYLTLGVLLLVATPIVRVLSGLYYFRRGGERTMAAIASTVFVLLLFGLFLLGPLIR
jgi:uncharacterized membrane protein